MNFQLSEPILIVGLGGVGANLATKSKDLLKSDCLLISNDQKDLNSDCKSIKISTKSVVNPSVQLIRGAAYEDSINIKNEISKYSTIIILANLAGKAGSALAPVVSHLSKESNKNVLSFAIMPFKFEKDRIFQSGISLKRLRESSGCTIVLDNDALLDSNPDLSPKSCHSISNEAIWNVIGSLGTTSIPEETNILSTSKDVSHVEDSLKDSLRMLYEDAPPSSVKRSILYILGGENIPVGVLNSVTNIASNVFNQENTSVSPSIGITEKSKVIMLSSIQGETHFDKYDPLGIISQEKTLDWEQPESSIDCELELYQLE
ncbi:MAG TPA: cell division protein FtsZ [Nitrosopumilaceae archaeon]|nr:cell division protein FtsZ [Nitrosopumilaceae archaeon]